MSKKHSFTLLSKTTSIYLLFTFIAFISSALFLIHEMDQFIHRDLENSFARHEHRLIRYIEEGKSVEKLHAEVRPIAETANIGKPENPVYSDTMIYSSSLDEMQQFRKKTVVFRANGQFYKASFLHPVDDFLKLRDDIFGSVIPAFIILAVAIVLFNFVLSGYFFRPFNRILGLMKTYKVGNAQQVKRIETNTTEFVKMQALFHQMIERIEDDYRHLKEYTENMAHELQTPLAVILNKAENLIADESVMRSNADAVKVIYDETNYLSKLGNSLNLLTKIENEEFSNAIEIETRPAIRKLVVSVEELASLKSLNIETDLSAEHRLLIDPFLLDIILKNLIRNAISYATADGPISIKTTADSLCISNFGPPLGVPEEEIFKRFYRNENSKSSLGLGLSLVKKICDLNNLRIEYRYREGQHLFCLETAIQDEAV